MAANGRHRRSDELIVAGLANGASCAEAGKVAGVSARTVQRRMAEPAFRAKVIAERAITIERVRGQLVAATPGAVETLIDLSSSAVGENARLGASRTLLDLTIGRGAIFDVERFSIDEVVRIMTEVVEMALSAIPEELHENFIHQVRAIGT